MFPEKSRDLKRFQCDYFKVRVEYFDFILYKQFALSNKIILFVLCTTVRFYFCFNLCQGSEFIICPDVCDLVNFHLLVDYTWYPHMLAHFSQGMFIFILKYLVKYWVSLYLRFSRDYIWVYMQTFVGFIHESIWKHWRGFILEFIGTRWLRLYLVLNI